MQNLNRYLFLLLLASLSLSSCEKYEICLLEEKSIFPSSNEYVAIFGDIQYIDDPSHIDIYQRSVDWIVAEIKKGTKIQCVLSTGDLTENNKREQWDCFRHSMKDLSKIVPYYSIIGDHDYTWYDRILIKNREDTSFNEYVNFPLSTSNILERFESGRLENIIVRTEIQGKIIKVVLLEFGPRKEVVEWADTYINSHQEDIFIIMTHEYLEKGGGRRTSNLMMQNRLRNTSYTTPDELWDKLIKKNNNIICVLCGHVDGLYALTFDTNDYGRDVPQIQHNIQNEEYRYDNWLMLWEIKPQFDSVKVFIYNTKTSTFYNDNKCLFSFAI